MAGDYNITTMEKATPPIILGGRLPLLVLLGLIVTLLGQQNVITLALSTEASIVSAAKPRHLVGHRSTLLFVSPHHGVRAESFYSTSCMRSAGLKINSSNGSVSRPKIGNGRHGQPHYFRPMMLAMYSRNDNGGNKPEGDEMGEGSNSSSTDDVVWTSLASTEKWIQETLKLGGNSGSNSQSSGETTPGGPRRPVGGEGNNVNNPYSRKEVQYECEESTKLVGVLAGIFTRLRSMREMGEEHCDEMQTISASLEGIEKKSRKFQSTLRQTLVVVSPLCRTINESFDVFDATIQTINQARRDARDYVLDTTASEQLPEEDEWVTSLNLSHLHPLFYYNDNYPGVEDVAKQEEDPKIQQYKEQRKKARQSPYPTVVLEVKASPALPSQASPMLGGRSEDPFSSPPSSGAPRSSDSSSMQGVPDEDVRKLEALFGKTAATSTADVTATNAVEEDAAAMAVDKFSSSIFSPLGQGQNWITENDTGYSMIRPEQNSFEVCPTSEVDAVYEFIFRYLYEQSTKEQLPLLQPKQVYILLPNFCSKSATSFEKFTIRLRTLLALLRLTEGEDKASQQGALEDTVLVSDYFHPEHIEKERRSPLPILSLRWGPVFPEQAFGNVGDEKQASSPSYPPTTFDSDDPSLGAFQ